PHHPSLWRAMMRILSSVRALLVRLRGTRVAPQSFPAKTERAGPFLVCSCLRRGRRSVGSVGKRNHHSKDPRWRVAPMAQATYGKVARLGTMLVLGGLFGLSAARADINGFNGGANWQLNGPGSIPSFSADGDTVVLTDDMNSEGVSLFYLDPQSVAAFTA